MKKIYVKYYVDVLLVVSFLMVFYTGLVKWPGLRRMIGNDAYQFFYFRNISFIHDWSGLVMGLLVLVHLVLNWSWLVAVTKSFFKKKKTEKKK